MNRNRLIVGIAILAILGIMSVIGLGLLLSKWTTGGSQLSQRTPVLELTNCSPKNIPPCVVSFGIDSDGNTLVNLLVPDSFPPDFYLRVIRNTSETRYECQMVENFPTHFYCVGEKIPPGGVLLFILIASKDDALLAKGDISVLGLAFPTIGISSANLSPVSTQNSGQNLSSKTPAPTQPIPKLPSPTKPSYPNPTSSYPNPSPSYP